jgi:hypothetical protein
MQLARTAVVDTGLLERVLDAYGGEQRWRHATSVETRISMGGLLLRLKGHPPSSLRDMHARTEIGHPAVRVQPIDEKGNTGVLEGQTVRLESPDGRTLDERPNIRETLARGKKRFRWDRLDAFYFIGYTQWTYNAFPALLWRDDVTWRQASNSTLEVEFAPELPTHSSLQSFHVDPATGLLRGMEYTAEVFGGWAKAAHVVEEHGECDGVPYPSRRRVWSRKSDGSPRTSPAPLMVALDVHEWRLL